MGAPQGRQIFNKVKKDSCCVLLPLYANFFEEKEVVSKSSLTLCMGRPLKGYEIGGSVSLSQAEREQKKAQTVIKRREQWRREKHFQRRRQGVPERWPKKTPKQEKLAKMRKRELTRLRVRRCRERKALQLKKLKIALGLA